MSPNTSAPLLTCFAPVIDNRTSILILGSFPGAASLTAQQYYAHPRNQFWKLLSALLDDDLVGLPYPQKLTQLQTHRIGLWDVIGACEREGSLDSAIRQAQTNDFKVLKQRCPQLQRVAFNGKTSGKHAPLFADVGFETIVLPSSSPAHASMTFEQKLAVWRGIMR
jgi:TDG/mug DNA glycosylase family protein